MQTTKLAKKELREEFLKIRRNIDSVEKKHLDTLICKEFLSTEFYQKAKSVFMYAPFGSEINVNPIAEQAFIDGKKVAFPVCNINDFTLKFYYVSSLDELIKGAHSINEPQGVNPVATDDGQTVCLVPALSFNFECYRIGYGKGYYDRFLKDFCGISVGLIYKKLISNRLIISEFDIPCDVLICEEGVVSSEYDR